MAKRKSRRRHLGSEPELHRNKAHHAFEDSAHHASLSRMAAGKGRCAAALEELVTAAGALEEGRAHAESDGGPAHSRWETAARRAVAGAEDAVSRSCFCKR